MIMIVPFWVFSPPERAGSERENYTIPKKHDE